MPALQHFFDAERARRGWSIRDIAKRAKISVSKAYAISNGDDNVEFETFENIATAFNMSPAELAVAIGKGSLTDDPKRVPLIALLRQVPDEDLGTVDRVVRPFAVQPTTPNTNAGNKRADKRRQQGLREIKANERQGGTSGSDGTIAPWSHHLADAFRSAKSGFLRPLPATAG